MRVRVNFRNVLFPSHLTYNGLSSLTQFGLDGETSRLMLHNQKYILTLLSLVLTFGLLGTAGLRAGCKGCGRLSPGPRSSGDVSSSASPRPRGFGLSRSSDSCHSTRSLIAIPLQININIVGTYTLSNKIMFITLSDIQGVR